MANQDQSLTKAWQTQPTNLTQSTVLTGTEAGRSFTNNNATGAITITLPKAKPGYKFGFLLNVAQNMVIQALAADTIRIASQTLGNSYTLGGTGSGVGSTMFLECITATIWEIVGGSTISGGTGGIVLQAPVTINAPSSGQALSVTGFAGSTAIAVTTPGTTGYGIQVTGTSGASAASQLLSVQQLGFSNGFTVGSDGTNMKYSFLNGNVTIGAPASGQTLTINNVGTTGTNDGISVLGGAGQNAGMECAGNGNTVGTSSLSVQQDSSGNGYLLQRANLPLYIGTNSSTRITVAAAGNVTIAAPASGQALTIYNVGSGGSDDGISVIGSSGKNAGMECAANGGVIGVASLFIGQDSSGNGYLYQRANLPLYLGTNGSTRVTVSAAGSVTFSGAIGINGTTPPSQTTGFGTPVGGAVVANYNITDAGGANSNTNKCVAEILTILKTYGMIGA